ncbi:hypothetical protein MJH12_06570 [bacterium]|nr:hypothetical protein [bacterium]
MFSPNEESLILDSGDVYNANNLEYQNTSALDFKEGIWTTNEIITLQGKSSNTNLIHKNEENELTTEYFKGRPLKIFKNDSNYILITLLNNKLNILFYTPSLDSDGDQIENSLDNFPHDPAISKDSDNDGYPDEWNEGYTSSQKNLHLTLDAFPFNSTCTKFIQGDNGECNTADKIPNYIPSQIVFDNGVVYLLSNNRIYRWSSALEQDLNPIILQDSATHMTYSSYHQRFYLTYSSGEITQISLQNLNKETHFTFMPKTPHGIISIEKIIMVADDSRDNAQYTFDVNGRVLGIYSNRHRSKTYAWSSEINKLFYLKDGWSSSSLQAQFINPDTGKFEIFQNAPDHWGSCLLHPVRVSIDATKVILGSGDIYSAETLDYIGTLSDNHDEALWINSGLITLQKTSENNTLLTQWDESLQAYNQKYYDGLPLRIFETSNDTKFAIVNLVNEKPSFDIYQATNDSDGDNVINTMDDFPTDPSISRDTDKDGVPDAWNPNYSSSPVSLSLTLDDFPYDSACSSFLTQTTSICDIDSTIGGYEPSQVEFDGNTLYLLNKNENIIYRWSYQQNKYLNPIVLKKSAYHMTYSTSQNSLYIAYESGHITQISTSQITLETPVFNLPSKPKSLRVVGDQLLTVHYSGMGGSLNLHSLDGQLNYQEGNFLASKDYIWSDKEKRIFLINNDFQYKLLDETGKVFSTVKIPIKNRSYNNNTLIRISSDEDKILLGNGDVFSNVDYSIIHTLENFVTDAIWYKYGLITIRENDERNTLIEQYGQDLNLLTTSIQSGVPTRIISRGERYIIITSESGTPSFSVYTPNEDIDKDGITNLIDQFPFDPSASIDSDYDGAPDSWHSGFTSSPTSPEMTEDFYPNDSACSIISDGSNGICDIESTIQSYQPKVIEFDGSIIYLLNSLNKKIHRWDSNTSTHLNPILLKNNATAMTYSKESGHIYLSYASNTITKISTQIVHIEKQFTKTAYSISYLDSVGQYIFVAESPKNYNRFYTYSHGGEILTSLRSYHPHVDAFGHNPMTNNMYILKDNYLESAEVRDSGYIVSDYITNLEHPSTSSGPIIVSTDGTQLVIGNGDVYTDNNMNYLKDIGPSFTDATFYNEKFALINNPGGGQTRMVTWDESLTQLDTYLFDGSPIKIIHANDKLIVITSVNGKPVFNEFVIE